MDASGREEPPPDSTNLAGWKRAAEQGRLPRLRPEAIFAALQDLRFNTDPGLRNELAKALSDRTYRLLWRRVGRNHPNGGQDIVDRVHDQIFVAIARPDSADGQGFRQAFVPRLEYRLKDAIAKEARERRIPGEEAAPLPAKPQYCASQTSDTTGPGPSPEEKDAADGEDALPSKSSWDPALLDGVRAAEQRIDVDRFLETHIADDRKRLAFRLFMEELPFKSIRSDSIAEAMGIDEKTARQWIMEIQAQLKAQIGDLA
jgi:RNA polymerase sigma factor (sigma-70 family)